ncbi:hypothetical protein AXE80_00760 [Wenyingzhuangia fucanilytica]|uniref:Uncharacterized protein n=1 Tax=Wenyingzhuangia fucanilytica TaxID=1790137 RepID=A0A1B1Y2B3_9FLAO|nr:hypothetical protein [Wenyingzhuangia fucanilytica]ANW94911.1 hypothetical protein AXE80_00760 [Wenyingzhuangia fucanilytica]
MDKIYKALSVILHPIFLPMFGTWVYLNVLPLPISKMQIYLIFFIVTGATFLVPLLTIFLLRFMGYIKSVQVTTAHERKLPVALMIVNYVFLAQMLGRIWQLRELTILAYATALGLIVTIFLLYKKIKVSLHMLGMAGLLGFTIVYGSVYDYPVLVIALLFILTGLLATVRLKLKAHNFKEIILGTALGLLLPILISFVL